MAKIIKAETPATETPVAETPVVAIVKPEPTSAKLIELREQRKAAKMLARTFEPDSDEENAALLDAYKIDQLIKAEIANIVNTERLAELQIARNERVQLNIAQFVALFGSVELFEAFKAAQWESKPELQLPFEAAIETVNNELLAKFALPKSGGGSSTTGGAEKQTTDGENLAAHLANIAAGMTDAQSRKAMETAGVPRSTAWHTVNNYNKSLVK